MDDIRAIHHLIGEIQSQKNDKSMFIADGRAADYAEYRHVCGQIRGLAIAEQICKDLVQRLEFNDE
jgi:hypothetical protein